MTRHQYIVFTEAAPGRGEEFEAWYDGQHLPDLLRVPGVVGAKRFRVDKITAGEKTPDWVSLAIYEIESDEPDSVIAEIMRRSGTDEMPLTDALVAPTVMQVMASPA
jgi:hypothetical protein